MGKYIIAGVAAAALLSFATSASAASTLFGSATTGGGVITLVSDTTVWGDANDYGGVSFDDANGMTVGSLTTLSTDYNVTDDDCYAGSPRFQIGVDTDGDSVSNGNVFVYLGPTPNFNGCIPNTWVSTGNLIGSTDLRFDLTQLGGGFYSTYADMLTLLGGASVLRISIVVDSGWGFSDSEQTVLVDNVNVNGAVYDFTPPPSNKDQCMNGGWKTFTNPSFKNQGQCVSSVVNQSPNR
jgi:hypothetical protein